LTGNARCQAPAGWDQWIVTGRRFNDTRRGA
jgi:hypothetical protein